MRVWKGPELEGRYKGDITMFVETTELDRSKIARVMELIIANREVTNLYLGAGRVDLKLDTNHSIATLKTILEKADIRGMKVTVETTNLKTILGNADLAKTLHKYGTLLVQRTDIKSEGLLLLDNIVTKLDDGESALFSDFKKCHVTDIADVKDGMYPIDTVIYDILDK